MQECGGNSRKTDAASEYLSDRRRSRKKASKIPFERDLRGERQDIANTQWQRSALAHRPDIQGILDSLYTTKKPREDVAIYKWPHLNIEDLIHGQSLPLLLNSRGRNNPDVFAHADLASCKIGLVNGKIRTAWYPDGEAVMVFVGQDTSETYGEFVHCTTNPRTILLWLAGVHFRVGEGLLILEVQQKIYEFLLDCCGKIFSDVPWDELLSTQLPQQPEPEPIETNGASYVDLASVVAEAPFRVPATLDTGRLLQLIEAKRAAAEDHAWSIREDPGYFKHVIQARSIHRQEHVRDAQGKKCPSLYSENFWNDVVLDTLYSTYTTLLIWDAFYDLTHALATKTPKGFGSFDYRKPLPQDVESVVLDMMVVADAHARALKRELSNAVPASQESHWVRVPNPHRTSTQLGKPGLCMTRKDMRSLKDDPLMGMFELLFDMRGAAIKGIGLYHTVDEIQRIIQSDQRQAQRLSPFVADVFSDLALMANICRVLDGLFPWSLGFERKQQNAEPLDGPQVKLIDIVQKIIDKGSENSASACEIRLPLPIKDSLDYPIHKVYGEQNVERLRRAEWNLDTFWNKWDHFFFSHTGETLNDILRRSSKGPRTIHRTLPYRPIERGTPTTPSPVIPTASIAHPAQEPETPKRLALEPPQAKIKTRGICNPLTDDVRHGVNEDTEVPVTDAAEKSKEITFKLKDRALGVFRTVFYTEDPNDRQGEVDWKDFLHAMTKVGFAAEKLYGSVWHFMPVEGSDLSRSFHVHQPHPETKIPHVMPRNIGRRLTHTYGWTAQNFGKA
ncbi:hypothetical protein LTR47_005505 [Exophiala xenobiotica]|nr:hypothetical protein LTR41_008872 [Exophiala xenobiotica]KAK5233412.1 hypothetical protein LTR47_005505 [Exophiala xenobiotica]KAK5247097.1 hypothetical protein LTS06_007717 [Exophiala xenobiotica]KAK5259224.1 hypothetical protein LTR40_006380 [Exophiala xenobiotica]KAK5349289.1 hypothetical protein LTR61_007327 [Exophiala xenobiotica]